MVAVFRMEVNHDGYRGTALDAMIWNNGSIPKSRSSSLRVIIDHASFGTDPGEARPSLSRRSGGCSCLAPQCHHHP